MRWLNPAISASADISAGVAFFFILPAMISRIKSSKSSELLFSVFSDVLTPVSKAFWPSMTPTARKDRSTSNVTSPKRALIAWSLLSPKGSRIESDSRPWTPPLSCPELSLNSSKPLTPPMRASFADFAIRWACIRESPTVLTLSATSSECLKE